ncbi:3-oxoadipate enol-lactonase 2 [Nymphon striatum]|nr:3-oxoadipate enol-lactonase 2 [Nymphon striatum]
MPVADLQNVQLWYQINGDAEGAPIVLSHALGTDLSIWDDVVARLPAGLKILRYDLRGHGASPAPTPPYSMGALVRDAEQLLDHLNIRDCVFVGLSVGGMIAQGLAVKRLDQIRALVLTQGIAAIVDDTLDRWMCATAPQADRLRAKLLATSPEGYAGCCAAIAGTDFYTPTSGLRLPVLGLAGTEDQSTPVDLVRETVDLVPGSQFTMLRPAGHLPMVENPDRYAQALVAFLTEIGHIRPDPAAV